MAKPTAGGGAPAATGHKKSNPFKHARHGARVGPRAPLPAEDDAWRRKLLRAKEAGVRRAKTRQQYAKVKARALAGAAGAGPEPPDVPTLAPMKATQADREAEAGGADPETMHPERQALLEDDDDDDDQENEGEQQQQRDRDERRRKSRVSKRPTPFQKAREEAAQRKAEAAARQAEFERRAAERAQKQAERARRQKAMTRARRVDNSSSSSATAKAGGGGGDRRKLGRESEVLLDRVRRLMGK